MPTLLAIDVSPRGLESVTRGLTERYVERWQEAHPGGRVIRRDLAETSIPPLDALWVKATFIPPAQQTTAMAEALRQSDALTAELVDADEVVIGSPIYNFTVPASLKAWIDVVVRFTVTFTPQGGLVRDKPVTAILGSREVFTPGSPMEHADFASPYLQFIFGYLGITSFRAVLAGDFFSLRTGRITRDEHLARYLPEVDAAAAWARETSSIASSASDD